MSERDIKVQAIINPISGVGSKRKIPKMIEGICSKKELFVKHFFYRVCRPCQRVDSASHRGGS